MNGLTWQETIELSSIGERHIQHPGTPCNPTTPTPGAPSNISTQ